MRGCGVVSEKSSKFKCSKNENLMRKIRAAKLYTSMRILVWTMWSRICVFVNRMRSVYVLIVSMYIVQAESADHIKSI